MHAGGKFRGIGVPGAGGMLTLRCSGPAQLPEGNRLPEFIDEVIVETSGQRTWCFLLCIHSPTRSGVVQAGQGPHDVWGGVGTLAPPQQLPLSGGF